MNSVAGRLLRSRNPRHEGFARFNGRPSTGASRHSSGAERPDSWPVGRSTEKGQGQYPAGSLQAGRGLWRIDLGMMVKGIAPNVVEGLAKSRDAHVGGIQRSDLIGHLQLGKARFDFRHNSKFILQVS